jgi:tRNA(fMet)-specific endonuclease VapC
MTGITRPHYLIDTVAAVARLNDDEAIIKLLNTDVPVSIPIITLGELYAGAENSSRVEANIEKIDKLASGAEILLCDEQTARQYAKISQQLRKRGRPIPQNDMWIAALAMQYGLTLVTRDAHFSNIDGLLLQAW